MDLHKQILFLKMDFKRWPNTLEVLAVLQIFENPIFHNAPNVTTFTFKMLQTVDFV